MRTGAQCVIDGLQQAGVERLFGIPGGTVLDIFARLYHAPFGFVLTRHEQGAVHMADGFARATGRPGACIVTSGPGATNAVTGLATANMDGVPLVCIAGQVPSHMIGNDAFQEADTIGITRGITKHNYLVRNVHDLPRILCEAFHLAASGKPGPVLIDIPKDIQRAQTDAVCDGKTGIRGPKPLPDCDAAIDELAEALNRARKPVLFVGGGAIAGDAAAELLAVAHRTQAPVTTTLMGLGAFPETDPLALRMLGMHGSVAANRAVSACDLLVSVGARFDDRVTGKLDEFAPHATIAHIDIDPSAISKSVRVQIAVVGHVKDVLTRLLPRLESQPRGDWLAEVGAWQQAHPFAYRDEPGKLAPQRVIESVYEETKGEATIVTDVGQHQMWSAHHFKYTRPRSFISSGGLGTMGFGLPAAIGAQFGCPDRTVVLIAGDGSIQMNFQELVVAVEHRLPVKVMVLNNGHLGMVRQWQEMFYNREYSATRLGQGDRGLNEKIPAGRPEGYLPDFVKLAEAHGADALRVSDPESMRTALRKALAIDGPVLIECLVEPTENVYPMVPPGASLTEMVHSLA
jgi:acetolactate synthase I/II/III large subunit